MREYLIDLNGKQAAIRAGYSVRRAEVTASELLADRKVSEAVALSQAKRVERTTVTADWVLHRLHEDATADLADLYDENGHLRPVHQWPKVWRTGLVAGIETTQERDGEDAEGNPQYVTVRKVKLADRTRIVELAGKHVGVGAFKDRLEIDAVVRGQVAYKANIPAR